MRIDLVIPNQETYGAEAVQACGELEQMGYDGLWFTDHVVGYEIFKPVYGAYWLEVLTAMTHAAAITEKARIGAGVLVLPYRNAVYTAKVLASIDVLSGGRVDLGVGTGWCKREFHALGVVDAFDTRGPRTTEALDVMLRCWGAEGDEEIGFDGEFSQFRGVQFQPVPVQQPKIPLWIGSRGTASAPLRRAAKYADVWHPTGLSVEEILEGRDRINELAGREVPVSARIRRAGESIADFAAQVETYREINCFEVAIDLESKSMAEFMTGAQELVGILSG